MTTKLYDLKCPSCGHEWTANLNTRQNERVCVNCPFRWSAKALQRAADNVLLTQPKEHENG